MANGNGAPVSPSIGAGLSAYVTRKPRVGDLLSGLFPELAPISPRSHELPEAVGIELAPLVKLVHKLRNTMVRLKGGKLPDIGKRAVKAAFLYSSHTHPVLLAGL
jgi:hypothetical protein